MSPAPVALLFLCFGLSLQISTAQNTAVTDPSKKPPGPVYSGMLYPNPSSKSITTPTAWGGARSYVFGFIGGDFPQPYRDKPDLVAAAGIGLGNAYKTIGITGICNLNDVHRFRNFTASFIASKCFGKGNSLSVGGLNLFMNTKQSDGTSSYYFVYSHAVQTLQSFTPGYSRLCYSIGVGTGRFLQQSPKDIAVGKSHNGTAVFGNMSYEVFKNFNVNGEWNGLNLGFGAAWRPGFKFPALAIGVTDLTRFSNRKPSFVIGIGQAFTL